MSKLKSFLLTTLLGGLTVILPVAIIFMTFNWIFTKLMGLITPIVSTIGNYTTLTDVIITIMVIISIILICFTIGIFERTALGKFTLKFFENSFLNRIIGYRLVKETIMQFIGEKSSPFSSVALVSIFNNDTYCTAFITDEHDNGMYSVFVPTGPNPTSGNIYHLDGKYVKKIDANVELTMKSIISCGSGSNVLVKKAF